jgi:hypothetical protein
MTKILDDLGPIPGGLGPRVCVPGGLNPMCPRCESPRKYILAITGEVALGGQR